MLVKAFEDSDRLSVRPCTELVFSGPTCGRDPAIDGPARDIIHFRASGLPLVTRLYLEVILNQESVE